MSQENPRLAGAILYANNVLGIPSAETAGAKKRDKQLLDAYWNPLRLSAEQFNTDPFRERLFLDTVDSILRGLHPKDRLVTRMHFGLDGTTPMSVDRVAKRLEVHRTTVNYHLGKTLRQSMVMLTASRAQLREFQKNQSTEELAERLDTLPPIHPYQR